MCEFKFKFILFDEGLRSRNINYFNRIMKYRHSLSIVLSNKSSFTAYTVYTQLRKKLIACQKIQM